MAAAKSKNSKNNNEPHPHFICSSHCTGIATIRIALRDQAIERKQTRYIMAGEARHISMKLVGGGKAYSQFYRGCAKYVIDGPNVQHLQCHGD